MKQIPRMMIEHKVAWRTGWPQTRARQGSPGEEEKCLSDLSTVAESAQFWLRLDTLEEDKDMSLTPPRPRPLPQPGLLLSLSSWLGLDLSMPTSSPAFRLLSSSDHCWSWFLWRTHGSWSRRCEGCWIEVLVPCTTWSPSAGSRQGYLLGRWSQCRVQSLWAWCDPFCQSGCCLA